MIQAHITSKTPERPTKPLSKRQLEIHRQASRIGERKAILDGALYTMPEVAALCSVSTETIRRAVENGFLVMHSIGDAPRFWGSDVRAWINAGGKTGVSKATKAGA